MTDQERVARVKAYFDPDALTEAEASAYLAIAKDTILDQLYSFAGIYPEDAVIPRKYEGAWCELAARYFSRKGGLGETLHIENGIHRDWYSSDDRDLLSRIIPYASVR